MPLNPYFAAYECESEQNIMDDLITEACEIFGVEMMYLPRKLVTKDELFTESSITMFDSAYALPIFVESNYGFQGEGNFLSKFNIEIRDQMEFSVPFRTFSDEVIALEDDLELVRPREGDLIYFPQRKACFQIMSVDKRALFYPLGTLYLHKFTAEVYEYSNERFRTGIEEIDALEQKYSYDLLQWAIHNEDGDYWITEDDDDIYVTEKYGNTSPEPWVDNEVIQDEANDFIVQDESDPFSWGNM